MKLTLENQELTTAINLLRRLDLKPGDSRHRTKLVKLLTEAVEAFANDDKTLLEHYANKDDDGKAIEKDGHYDVPDTQLPELGAERLKLKQEERVIEGGMYVRNIDAMPAVLENITETLSGQEADIYDKIMDQFDEQKAEAENAAKNSTKKAGK